MKFINPIYLISVEHKSDNKIGNWIPYEKKRKVYADISSIRQSEFYNAKLVDMKPEISLNVRGFEYNAEKFIIYQNIKYEVLRTYDRGNGIIEIVCSEFVGIRNEENKY